jgi:hypothetical protein
MAVSDYDEAKDSELGTQQVAKTKYGYIEVKVYSYNGGERKVQLNRVKLTKERGGYQKIGRLTKGEFTQIAQAVKAFIEKGVL